MDTNQGWAPLNLNAWGKKNIGTVDDALDIIDTLDTATGTNRKQLWELLQRGTGRWANVDPTKTLKVTKSKPID